MRECDHPAGDARAHRARRDARRRDGLGGVLTVAATAPPRHEHRPSLLARVLLGVIRLYQATSSFRAPRCRFQPTCSSYAAESVRVHGALRGGWFAICRIARCHPWNPGGVDPVQPRN
ncbi:MAG: membrane protein insertion efficiency factor YidD [Nitriliruptorales bacterium]|nr:membrane protein insertion efficiency factor YidD [Nitriliruptorales bacterium]